MVSESKARPVEESLIGSVLKNPKQYITLREIVSPGDFETHTLGWAWKSFEELHERGEVRSIKVQPKVGRPYEIVPATGGRDMSNSAGNGRAAAGQRVWPVLSF